MRTYNKALISKSVIIFCRLVKFGSSCTAAALDLNGRTAAVLKTVLTKSFSIERGDPIDFPRLFICDDAHKQLFHKCTTPNSVDLSDLNTIDDIITLMAYVSRQKRNKVIGNKEVNDKSDSKDLIKNKSFVIDLSKLKPLSIRCIYDDSKLTLSVTFSS